MILGKKIICLIPARGGSKGIKLKNLQKIKNRSLLEIAGRFAKKCNFIDTIFVNSDNKKILNLSKNIGLKTIKRKKNLSGDRISDYQVISSSLNYLKDLDLKYDYLIYLQPTSPFRVKKDLLKSLKKIILNKSDSIWSVTKVIDKYHPYKVLENDKDSFLKLHNNIGKKIVARQQLKDIYIRNGIFYIFKIKSLLKYKSIYLPKTLKYEIDYEYVNIDNHEDLKKAKKIFV
jgi:CMP-N,N'-diacetyllegionaminic acid synthase